jgi:hypothetical protein
VNLWIAVLLISWSGWIVQWHMASLNAEKGRMAHTGSGEPEKVITRAPLKECSRRMKSR